jgi:predicted pyridoxine 5'-phosphate oxidase superfamily flavin-nucleotide-binding protein
MAVVLTDEFKTAINNAIADRAPIVLASVDESGQPALSFRGSAQVYSDHEIGIWVRNQDGGLLKSIEANPLVAMMYRNPETRLSFQLHGEAHRKDDEATRQRVYEAAPEVERNADAERKGTAVVVDLLRVIQRGAVVMERD